MEDLLDDLRISINIALEAGVKKENIIYIDTIDVIINNITWQKTNPPPKPKEPAETVMEVAGNPIAILLAVIVLGGAIAIVLHRKD